MSASPASTPTFRLARQADAPFLVDLIERAYRGPETAGSWASEAHLLKGPRTSLAEVSSLISREDSRFLIAEADSRIVACCLLQGLNRPEHDTTSVNAAYFGMFALDPHAQGGGLGKQVIAEAEQRIQDMWGCNEMVMTVINLRTELIGWYQRRGYRLTGATLPFPFSETSGETTRDFHLVEMRKRVA
jgi:ribosomal protein S18 acetylase RimI-like enzyme